MKSNAFCWAWRLFLPGLLLALVACGGGGRPLPAGAELSVCPEASGGGALPATPLADYGWGAAFASDALEHGPLLPSCAAGGGGVLRVATLNIAGLRDASLADMALALRALDADVIALQEVRVGGDYGHQAADLARALGYAWVYAAAADLPYTGASLGNALLARNGLLAVGRIDLRATGQLEPRVATQALACLGGQPARLLSLHLDINEDSPPQQAQAQQLAQGVGCAVGEELMVLGDFNAEVGSQTLAPIEAVGLADVVAPYDTQSTYSTGDTRIDLILADAPLAARVRGARVIETGLSDHRAVLVELQP